MLPSKPQPAGEKGDGKALLTAKRGCTDPGCVLLFFGHVCLFWYLTVEGFQKGNLSRLYLPRDFAGAYCGAGGRRAVSTSKSADSTASYPTLAFAMNTAEVLDKVALEALCASNELSSAERPWCPGGGSGSALQELPSPTEIIAAAGVSPTSVMSEATRYLTEVCTSTCSLTASRKFTYSPPPDVAWASAYKRLASSLPSIQLDAWDESVCPYDVRYCVPFPGISLERVDDLCLPKLDGSVMAQLGQTISKQLDALASSRAASEAMASVQDAWGSIINSLDALGVVAFLATILGVLYMCLVRFFAKPVVWLTILLLFLVLIAGGSLTLIKSMQCAQVDFLDSTELVGQQALTVLQNATGFGDGSGSASAGDCQDLGGYAIANNELRQAVRIAGYCLLSLAGLWLLFVICCRNRIRLAIAVNQVAAEFTASHPSVILLPLVQMLLSLALLAIWGLICGLLITVTSPSGPSEAMSQQEAMGNSTVPGACSTTWPAGFAYRDVTDCNTTGSVPLCWHCAPPRFLFNERFAYAFFSYLWHNALLAAIGQCIVAGAVGRWFFTERGSKAFQPVFCVAVVNALFWHFGSLAFGSLILAIVQFLKWLMRFLSEQAKVRKNRVMQVIFKALACCLWCFEKCVKFLNKNAYIQVAVRGTNFCTSAQNAFFLILRNAIRFGVLAMLGPVLYFIGVLFMAGVTGLVGYYVFEAFHPGANPVVPTVVYVILGYLIGRLFLAVFRLACDTSLQCFIMAEETHQRGDFVPKALESLMEERDLSGETKGGCCC